MISSCYTTRLPPNSVFYSVVSPDRREEAQLLSSRVLGKRDPTCLVPSGPTLNLPSHTHLTSKIVNRKNGTLSPSHINVLLINCLNRFLEVGKLKMSLKHQKTFRNWPVKAVSKRTLLHRKSIVPGEGMGWAVVPLHSAVYGAGCFFPLEPRLSWKPPHPWEVARKIR